MLKTSSRRLLQYWCSFLFHRRLNVLKVFLGSVTATAAISVIVLLAQPVTSTKDQGPGESGHFGLDKQHGALNPIGLTTSEFRRKSVTTYWWQNPSYLRRLKQNLAHERKGKNSDPKNPEINGGEVFRHTQKQKKQHDEQNVSSLISPYKNRRDILRKAHTQQEEHKQQNLGVPAVSMEQFPYYKRCWQQGYSRSDRRPVDHTPGQFLLGKTSVSCRGDIFLLLAVHSAVPNRAQRDLIRSTWAAVAHIGNDRFQTVFFVGTTENHRQAEALRRESNSQADIVQADFVDTYRNLTYKNLYALKWIAETCHSVRFVMKVDDDVVLNVFKLRESLRENIDSTTGDFFYCQVSRIKPIRDRSIKWHVTIDEWPGEDYPDYCKGFGYVMTAGLVKKLLQCAKWRRYFWIEDVFVSGALANALGAPRIQWEDGWGFTLMHPRLAGPEAAHFVIAITFRSVTPSLHRRVWRAIVRFSDWGIEDT